MSAGGPRIENGGGGGGGGGEPPEDDQPPEDTGGPRTRSGDQTGPGPDDRPPTDENGDVRTEMPPPTDPAQPDGEPEEPRLQAGDGRTVTQAEAQAIAEAERLLAAERAAEAEPAARGAAIDVEAVERLGEARETLERARRAAAARLSGAAAAASALPTRVERQLERAIEEQTGEPVDLSAEDITFETEDDAVVGTLTEAGRERVAIETAPVVQAAEAVGIGEEQARSAAGAAFEFREFGQRTRAEVVQPRLQRLRELSGLEPEIEAFEAFGATQRGRLERQLAAAGERVSDLSPTEIAAAAAPVAIAEPTPAGELAIGTLLAGAAVATAAERATTEQQLGAGAIAQVAAAPGATAEQLATGADVDVTARAEVPGLFPTEQEVPEDRDLFDTELAIQEDPIFLPEVLLPAQPAAQFATGRFTPPEIAVEPGTTEVEFFGPEVAVDTTDPGDFGPGAELPTPTLEARGQQLLERAREAEERAERTRERLDIPEEFIPDEPVVIGGGVGEGIGEAGRERGAGGGFRVVFRQSPRSIDPVIIETPFAEIDIAGIDPQLARVIEQPTLEADVTPRIEVGELAEAGADITPDTPGIFGLSEIEAETLGTGQVTSPATLAEQISDTLAEVDVTADVTTTQQQAQRQRAATATATPTAPGTGAATAAEIGEPTATATMLEQVTATTLGAPATPTARPEPVFDIEGEDDDEDLLDPLFFEEAFEFGVATPEFVLTGGVLGDLTDPVLEPDEL